MTSRLTDVRILEGSVQLAVSSVALAAGTSVTLAAGTSVVLAAGTSVGIASGSCNVSVLGSVPVFITSGSCNVGGSVRAGPPGIILTSASVASSGGVTLLSVNVTGAEYFTLTNAGSTQIYVNGSYDGQFFFTSVAMTNPQTGASVTAALASTVAYFQGPFYVVRVLANSGSGNYQPTLTYR